MTNSEITQALESARFSDKEEAARYWNRLMREHPAYESDFWLVAKDGQWTFELAKSTGGRMLLE